MELSTQPGNHASFASSGRNVLDGLIEVVDDFVHEHPGPAATAHSVLQRLTSEEHRRTSDPHAPTRGLSIPQGGLIIPKVEDGSAGG